MERKKVKGPHLLLWLRQLVRLAKWLCTESSLSVSLESKAWTGGAFGLVWFLATPKKKTGFVGERFASFVSQTNYVFYGFTRHKNNKNSDWPDWLSFHCQSLRDRNVRDANIRSSGRSFVEPRRRDEVKWTEEHLGIFRKVQVHKISTDDRLFSNLVTANKWRNGNGKPEKEDTQFLFPQLKAQLLWVADGWNGIHGVGVVKTAEPRINNHDPARFSFSFCLCWSFNFTMPTSSGANGETNEFNDK